FELWPAATLPEELASLARERERPSRRGHIPAADFTPQISTRIQDLIDHRLKIRHLWNGEDTGHRDTTASGNDFALAMELVRARVPFSEIVDALGCRPGVHRPTAEYCQRTAKAAFKRVTGRTV